MIKQLAHICINTTDLNETARFYCNALGLEKGFEFIKRGELFGFYIKLGSNTFVEFFRGEPGQVGNINHMAIEVEDIDKVIAKIRDHGYGVGEKTFGADHGWQAWLEDPNGVRIELQEYTEESLQLRGGKCEVTW